MVKQVGNTAMNARVARSAIELGSVTVYTFLSSYTCIRSRLVIITMGH